MSQDNTSWRHQDSFLAGQIDKTVDQIRRVEWFALGAQLATLALGSILLGIILDHWIFPGGLSVSARLVFAIAVLFVLFVTLIRRIIPLLIKRVNPLYAASVLEGGQSNKRNFIINWFQLRNREELPNANSSELNHAILQGVVRQANEEVKGLPDDSPVDHSAIIRWGIVFTVLLAILAVYSILSPKNPITSIERLVFPTSKIQAPLSVRFIQIKPGDVSIFVGDTITLEAEIAGVGKKPVFFSWTTDDRRIVDRTVPMEFVAGNTYKLLFPTGTEGLTEPISYRILVGLPGKSENYSPSYRVTVRQPMAIAVERLKITFPDYTKRAAVLVENSGDIRALWGSSVEVVAKANSPLKSAFFLPRQKEELARTMNLDASDPLRATLTFTPQKENGVPSQEPTFTPQDTWSILCHDQEGNANRSPATYSIEMYDDMPPNITWESAPNGQPKIPLNSSFVVKVRVEDPDFGLTSVVLAVAPALQQDNRQAALLVRDQNAQNIELLAPESEKPLIGELVLSGTVRPSELKLTPGLEYEYRVIAFDGKTPAPNKTSTSVKSFIVTEPTEQQDEQTQQPEQSPEQKKDDQSASGQDKGKSSQDQSQDGQSKDDSSSQDGQNQEGKQQDGNDKNEDGKQSQDDKQQPGDKSESAQGQDGKQQDGNDKNEDGKQGQGDKQQSGDKSQSGQGQDGKQQDGNNKNEDGKQGQGDKSQSGQGQDGKQQDGNDKNEDGKQGQGDQQQSGDKSQSAQGQGGKQQDGNGKNEDGKQDNNGDSSNSDGSKKESSSNESKSDSPSGSSGQDKKTDETAGQDSSSGDGKQENQSGKQGKEKSKSDSPSSMPIDPDANPGDAFERIMDHMEQNGKGSAGQQEQPGENKQELQSPPTGGNKASDSNGKEVKGPAPDELAQGLERKQGDVAPNSKDLMTKQVEGKLPEKEQKISPDSRVVDDPDNPVQGEQADGPTEGLPSVKSKNPNNFGTDSEVVEPSANQNQRGNSSDKPTMNASELGINADQMRDGGQKTDNLAKAPAKETKQSSQQNQEGQNKQETQSNQEKSEGLTGAGASDSNSSEKENKSDANQSLPGGTTHAPSPEGNSDSQQVGGGHASSPSAQDKPETTLADDPNIQYTEKATNLVLEYLEDQVKDKVDPTLLNELGWTEDQLKQFLKKWKSMKENAKKSEATQDDRVSYLESLRNIGLKSGKKFQKQTGGTLSDKEQRANTETTRFTPPPSFKDRFRAFNRGVSKEQNR